MATSGKHSGSSKSSRKSHRRKTRALDRPFAPAILVAARKRVGDYTLIVGRDQGDIIAQVLEYPGVMGTGETEADAIKLARELLQTTIAFDLERGEPLPAPARDEKRSEQVNIRLTALERLRLESLAQQKGFRSISDYIRAAALARAG